MVPCSWVENQIHIIYVTQLELSRYILFNVSTFINAKFHDPYSRMDPEICSKLRLEYPNAMIGALIGGRGLQVCAAGAYQNGIMSSGKFFDTTFHH